MEHMTPAAQSTPVSGKECGGRERTRPENAIDILESRSTTDIGTWALLVGGRGWQRDQHRRETS